MEVNLDEFGKHNGIEHNASLVHNDTLEDQIYAPIEIDHSLVDALVFDVKPGLAEIKKSRDPTTARFLMNCRRCGEGSYSQRRGMQADW